VLFPTIDFAIFFVIVFLLHWVLNPYPRPWKVFMIVASYTFYAWWDWRLVWLLLLVSVIAQLGARAVYESGPDLRRRRTRTVAAVVATLAPLAWFKYYGFLSFNFDGLMHGVGGVRPLPLLELTLPVGISFYSFMAVSYVVDVWRREARPAAWLDLLVYLSFFPHLVAGPIVRDSELIPQIRERRDPRHIDVGRAMYLIFGGLFKKIVVASFLSTAIVDPVFGAPGVHSSLEILFAVYAYAIVIYADFSGYTDIAIGLALLLGFRFPQNFDRPYSARSLQDFWRRWHMTLSRWLRDYLYIPLGGNKKGTRRTYLNIMITMLLGGLWHGAGWTFVIWGAYHGLGQVIGHYRRGRRAAAGLAPQDERPWALVWQRVATFNLVCLGWIFFRADSVGTAIEMIWRLFTAWGSAPLVTAGVALTIAGMLALQYAPRPVGEQVQLTMSRMRPAILGVALALAMFVIVTLGPSGVAPFIYFRF
jgi:D-alanyl-lipoteichoic acid acyltransferase DltB (MBOAT superfamily)